MNEEAAQRAVDMGEPTVAQIHLRRQPFDRAFNNARRIAGLDFTGRQDREMLDEAVMRV